MLVLLGQYLLFRLSSWLYQKAKARIQQLKDTKLKPISIQNYEILDTQKQVKLLVFIASIIRYLLLFILLVLTIPILFSIFPQTKELAYKIAYYIWNPVKSILVGISGLYPQPVHNHCDLPDYKIYYPGNPLPGNGNRCGKVED